MTLDPVQQHEHGEDIADAVARKEALVRRRVKSSVKRLSKLVAVHGGPASVALANMGTRGVRVVLVAADGTFGDVIVPSVAAANEVCVAGGWEIKGWDTATVQRIAPSAADRRRMAGTGR